MEDKRIPKGPAEVIPVFEETLRIDKTVRDADRLLIKTLVQERTEYIDLDLRIGDAQIERVQVNRVVETAPGIREEGDTIRSDPRGNHGR
jgi:hypothetical protein